MTWVRFDDGAPLHPKVLGLSDGAFRLWFAGLAFANRAVTDGFIPKSIVPTLDHRRAWKDSQIARFERELASAGMWVSTQGGYEIHGYAEYQEEALKTSVEARKAGARERKRRQREREKLAHSPPSHAVTGRDTGRDMPRDIACDQPRDVHVTDTVTESVMSHPPVPSRPVPSASPSEKNLSSTSSPSAPASPKPDLVRPVFEAWLEEHVDPSRRSGAVLNKKRRQVIQARLREGYGQDRLIAAIRGVKLSTWHMGENDERRKHNGLQTILRDGEQVEKFEALLANPPRLGPQRSGSGGMRPCSPDSEFLPDGDPDELIDSLFATARSANA